MATFEVHIDPSFIKLVAKAYSEGLEDGFMLANNTPDLDTELNINNIDLNDGE